MKKESTVIGDVLRGIGYVILVLILLVFFVSGFSESLKENAFCGNSWWPPDWEECRQPYHPYERIDPQWADRYEKKF